MGALLSALFGFFAEILARLFSVEVAKFLAYKVLLTFLVFSGLVIVYQLIVGLSLDWISQVLQQTSATSGSVVLNVAGVGGWLLTTLKIPQCLSVYLSAKSLNVVLRMLPFSPAK
jgi:hypothetical protein